MPCSAVHHKAYTVYETHLGFDAVKLVLGMALGSQVRKRLLQAGLL